MTTVSFSWQHQSKPVVLMHLWLLEDTKMSIFEKINKTNKQQNTHWSRRNWFRTSIRIKWGRSWSACGTMHSPPTPKLLALFVCFFSFCVLWFLDFSFLILGFRSQIYLVLYWGHTPNSQMKKVVCDGARQLWTPLYDPTGLSCPVEC